LALVRNLVALHGGTVTAHSEGPGKGSEFTVRLPAARSKEVELDKPAPPKRRVRPATAARRVLLVDDDRDTADVLAEALRSFEHEVAVAHEASEALGMASEFRPDVVVLDIGLPRMDGYELARALRRSPHGGRRSVRIVAVTGYGREADRDRSRAAGIDAHLVKPVDLETLIGAIVEPSAPSG
jgi:CheY-like chemotaxis protein